MARIFLLFLLLFSVSASAQMEQRVQKTIEEVRSRLAPDKRQAVYNIKAKETANGKITVSGQLSEIALHDSLTKALDGLKIDYIDNITLYPSNLWALSRISVANMRTKPGHASELASQTLMGTPLRLLEKSGDWWMVQTPDGYIAWIVDTSIQQLSDKDMRIWRSKPRAVVTSIYQTRCYSRPSSESVRDVVSDLVNGNILVLLKDAPINGMVHIELPDGRRGWVKANELTPIEQWANQDFDADKILDMAYSMMGQPYLWGGTSTKSLDCSGLVKVCYLYNGLILRRDASQQALTGLRIAADNWRSCRAGDLLFFGNTSTGRVTHVAIYDKDGNYVHSSGRVKLNSVDPDSKLYLQRPLLHAVRISGHEGTDGIIKASEHPWYFNF